MVGERLVKQISDKSIEILLKYPTWRKAVIEAESQPLIPANYQPDVIEFFDQQGLLASRVYGYVFSNGVPVAHRTQFIALYFDGELVLFLIGGEIVLSRLAQVSIFGLFELSI
jgi:hypothetical protein